MDTPFSVEVEGWPHGGPIPAKYAFGQPGDDGPFAFSANISPAIRWANAPQGTRSFAIICHDPDVPSSGEDVNQAGKVVPADLPRVDFYHWVLVDIPASVTSFAEGAVSQGVTPRGKATGPTAHGVAGFNDYTGWFAGDPDMEGTYGGYDGPAPPWNDSIVHHYHFEVLALDVETLGLQGEFGGAAALAAMQGHILARASYMGTYSLNPDVPA